MPLRGREEQSVLGDTQMGQFISTLIKTLLRTFNFICINLILILTGLTTTTIGKMSRCFLVAKKTSLPRSLPKLFPS